MTQRKIGRENLVIGTAAPSMESKDSLGKSAIDFFSTLIFLY
jgi:hypothetical protein